MVYWVKSASFFFSLMICCNSYGAACSSDHLLLLHTHCAGPLWMVLSCTLTTHSSWVLVGWSHRSSITPAFRLWRLSPEAIPSVRTSALGSGCRICPPACCCWGGQHSHVGSSRRVRGWSHSILLQGSAHCYPEGGRLVDFDLAICQFIRLMFLPFFTKCFNTSACFNLWCSQNLFSFVISMTFLA